MNFTELKQTFHPSFPLCYTHSIPWALVGKEKAKSNRNPGFEWYNQLDKFQRDLKRGETQGIPIGPGTSHIISEIILYKIDKMLRKEEYQFTRYVDDYTCYCDTRDKADNFVLNLERQLREYLLNLNPQKVLIEELPIAIQTEWIVSLRSYLPLKKNPPPRDIMDFLDFTVGLQKSYPEANVLKYATRTLANSKDFDKNSASFFLEYLIAIAFHNPSMTSNSLSDSTEL